MKNVLLQSSPEPAVAAEPSSLPATSTKGLKINEQALHRAALAGHLNALVPADGKRNTGTSVLLPGACTSLILAVNVLRLGSGEFAEF